MQVSLNWLRDYIDLSHDVAEITDLLTFSGIEVENSYIYGPLPETVVAAKITDSKKVEGSDHLQVCQVDYGKEVIQVVCGAPNCRINMIGALALPGTRMGEITIKKSKIRGVESSGMLCSEKELGLSEDHNGIIELPPETIPGTKLTDILGLPDHIFELEITPNRPDLLGYHGIASDLASSSGSSFRKSSSEDDNFISEIVGKGCEDVLSVDNQEPELCLRYVARVLRNVRITESPLWLKLRLIKSGLRPINNVVDITNYVMLVTGHPLHAFDYDKLAVVQNKPVILIRRAHPNEVFPALDGNQYILNNENLVIADSEKAIALAGVIGGTNSHITNDTVNVVLEAACFQHTSIRKTSYQHKISTDSSYRFERQLAPDTCEESSRMAVKMMSELAGAQPVPGSIDNWLNPSAKMIIPLRPLRIKQVIGIDIEHDSIVKYLTNLGLTYVGEGSFKNFKTKADKFSLVDTPVNSMDTSQNSVNELKDKALYFEIPPQRVDLSREIDLVEEVIRVHGMDKVPQKTKLPLIMDRNSFLLKRKASDYLVGNGFQEIVNLSFTDPIQIQKLKDNSNAEFQDPITLLNPQNINLSIMRPSLIPQLLQTAEFNIARQIKQIKIFELNKIFLENQSLPKIEKYRLGILVIGDTAGLNWRRKPEKYGFYDIKGLVTGLCNKMGMYDLVYSDSTESFFSAQESQAINYHNKIIAEYGKLKPYIANKFGIDTLELKHDVWIADIDLAEIIEIVRNNDYSYRMIPKYPSTERDLSFLIRNSINHNSISEFILDLMDNDLSELQLIDEYRGKQIPHGQRSLTYRFIFNNPEKTLTDEEVDNKIELVIKKLTTQWEIQLR
jgi:phenylalanyl-tRNA synthetase beta chain